MIRILIGSVHSTAIQSLGRFPNGFSFVTHVDFMYTWYKTIFIKLIWPTHDLKGLNMSRFCDSGRIELTARHLLKPDKGATCPAHSFNDSGMLPIRTHRLPCCKIVVFHNYNVLILPYPFLIGCRQRENTVVLVRGMALREHAAGGVSFQWL